MTLGTLLLFVLVGAAVGLFGWFMSFRQAAFRALLRRASGREARTHRADREEGAFYANRIFGTMLMSFGLIVIVFATTFYFVS